MYDVSLQHSIYFEHVIIIFLASTGTVDDLYAVVEFGAEYTRIHFSEISENACLRCCSIMWRAEISEHSRPNFRMNNQELRVFNGFYKQILYWTKTSQKTFLISQITTL
jgi:hypothetical protein